MTVQVTIGGMVQGVGFRQFVKHEARRKNIVGYVRNLPDGSVEAIFQGEEEAVAYLIRRCHQGPMLAQVKSIEVTKREEGMYPSFEVRS